MSNKIKNMKKQFAALGVCLMMVLMVVFLGGCAVDAGSDSNSTEEKPKTESPSTKENVPDSSVDTVPVPTTTGYLQEGNFGENNVVAFIVKEDDGIITKLTMQFGNVLVEGNMTQKKNYTIISTSSLDENDASAFSYAFNGGSIAGAVENGMITGTLILDGVGEFPIDAPVTEIKTCDSCNGSGSSGSISCVTCTGVGTLVAYRGTYI